jgi:DHA2 family lincomycin resistance protein-like MFS transporter
MVILLPIYLQEVRGVGSLSTGLMLLPGGLLMGLLGPQVGKIFDRYGPKALTILGASLLTLTMWRLSTVDAGTPIWLLVGLHVMMSIGLACLFTPAFTTGLNPLPRRLYSHGSAILATLQQVAGAAGTALLVAIMASRTSTLVAGGVDPIAAQNGGIQTAFGVATGIVALAIGCAIFMRNPKPEPAGPPDEGSRSADDPDVEVRPTERNVDPQP